MVIWALLFVFWGGGQINYLSVWGGEDKEEAKYVDVQPTPREWGVNVR